MHLLTPRTKSLLTFCTNLGPEVAMLNSIQIMAWAKTTPTQLISTCSTLRQSGVPTPMPPTRGMPASMLITGRISEGNHTLTITRGNSALSGRPSTLCKPMPMAARMNIAVVSRMDGRNKSTTRSTTRCMRADRMRAALSLIVLTSTQSKIGGIPSGHTSNYSRKTEVGAEEVIKDSISSISQSF